MVRPTTLYRSTGALNIRDKSSSPENKKDFSQFKYNFRNTGKDYQSETARKEVLAVKENIDHIRNLLNMVHTFNNNSNLLQCTVIYFKCQNSFLCLPSFYDIVK